MTQIHTSDLPSNALLEKYKQAGAFVDCYYINMNKQVTLAEYIHAFYTTPIFKIERTILSIFARRPSSDSQAKELSLGNSDTFSIWSVEQRLENQILLCEFTGNTRSWLMVATSKTDASNTRLYFGSTVIPKESDDGKKTFGVLFHLLGGFHRLYSRALLKAAAKKVTEIKT